MISSTLLESRNCQNCLHCRVHNGVMRCGEDMWYGHDGKPKTMRRYSKRPWNPSEFLRATAESCDKYPDGAMGAPRDFGPTKIPSKSGMMKPPHIFNPRVKPPIMPSDFKGGQTTPFGDISLGDAMGVLGHERDRHLKQAYDLDRIIDKLRDLDENNEAKDSLK